MIAIIIAAVVFALLSGGPSNAAATFQAPQTESLARMDLQQIVAGTGTLQSSAPRDVSSSLSYDVAEVYVKEGDRVSVGQLLASLDTTQIDKDIADARASIAEAEAKDALSISQAQRKLEDANNTRDINKARNDSAVQSAYGAIEGTRVEAGNAAGTSALDAWATQQADAAAAAEKAALDLAQTEQTNAENYYYAYDPTDEAGYQNALTLMQQAQENTAAAQGAYDAKWQGEYQAASSAGHETVFVPAYDAAYNAADVSAQQSAYDSAVETRDSTYRSDSINVENAQDSVNTQRLQDSAASYRTQLDGLLEDKEECVIAAPVAGTITAMNAEVGQSAGGAGASAAATGTTGSTGSTGSSGSALFTIEDTGRLEISASIPEYDVVNVSEGMQVTITTDALAGEEWSGAVSSISPKATDDSGNFTVLVDVVSPVGELAIGMSAKINIVTESKANVFAVPYDAVTTNELGQSVVYVMEQSDIPGDGDGAPEQGMQPPQAGDAADAAAAQPSAMGRAVVVQTGMEGDYYIEITGDELREGMLVLTDPEGKNVSDTSGGMGMMMGGGMGGGMP